MINALRTAHSGVQLGVAKLDAAAANIARASEEGTPTEKVEGRARDGGGVSVEKIPGVDDGITANIVESIIAKHTVSANAAVFRTADKVAGELIDLLG